MEVSVGRLVGGAVVNVAAGVLDGCPGNGVLVGKIRTGRVGVAGCGSQGGTKINCPVCRRVEAPWQLARWRSATLIP